MQTSSKPTYERMKCCSSEVLWHYLLGQLEKFPKSLFWASDLQGRSAECLKKMLSTRLLQPVSERPQQLVFPCPCGSHCQGDGREVVESNGQLWAICNCPAGEPPLRISREDLTRYSFNMDALVETLRTENTIEGCPSPLGDRLIYMGETACGQHSVAWVFAFLRDDGESVRLLESLFARIPGAYSRLLVLTPFYSPPPEDALRLEGLGIFVVSRIVAREFHVAADQILARGGLRPTGTAMDWPDDHFKDEDGTWLTAKILEKRFNIPNSRLKDWRENGCPALDGQKLGAKKVGGIGWVYARIHANQISNRRFDEADVEDRLAIAARIDAASAVKSQQRNPKSKKSR
jgi:hypothetical protein